MKSYQSLGLTSTPLYPSSSSPTTTVVLREFSGGKVYSEGTGPSRDRKRGLSGHYFLFDRRMGPVGRRSGEWDVSTGTPKSSPVRSETGRSPGSLNLPDLPEPPVD